MLKHFDWPEQKADALREAAFGYCDLKKLEAEASLFRDNPRQPCGPALKKMQALLEKYVLNIHLFFTHLSLHLFVFDIAKNGAFLSNSISCVIGPDWSMVFTIYQE